SQLVHPAAQQVSRIFNYAHGELDGLQISYHPNGQMAALISYQAGKIHGKKMQWDKDENIIEEAHFDLGKLNGRYFQVSAEGEELVFHYKDNSRHGVHQIYYPKNAENEKVKKLDATFVNDVLEGEVSEYSEKGIKISSTYYQNGVREGISSL